ncbi:MAG: cofactor-independent phosphoglycerate mutase [Ruminococcaceae bacterium]|nr:cofactor-independent phosphoglycerate mutase [Oscillospiraceae bacterium]
MKNFVLVFDGMADRPVPELGGKTPMDRADAPTLERICKKGIVGTVLNVPAALRPESDTANLAIMSYDPLIYSNGRSPLEALSLGIELADDDTAIRCNVVTLSEADCYEDRVMLDHSADEISSEEARVLVEFLESKLGSDAVHFYPGVSYRHCSVWKNADPKYVFTPPHDIIGKRIGDYLPGGDEGEKYLDVMKKSAELLRDHPVNLKRIAEGKNPANSAWFWSPGKKPALPCFDEKWGLKSAVISAVDLIKGIAIAAKMKSIDVDGATGNIHTNYKGKADAAIKAFEDGYDYVYVHVEAPDECGHRGEIENKVLSIEYIDKKILAPVLEHLESTGEDFKVMALPDHPTPLEIRTHSREHVPFVIYSSNVSFNMLKGKFNEENAAATGLDIPDGTALLPLMLSVNEDTTIEDILGSI